MNQGGYFISLEGIDGSGKTTLSNRLQQYFREQGQPFCCLREPGGTQVSEAIRQILLNPDFTDMTPQAEAFLYAAARAQVWQQLIQPALAAGQWVLADRFTDSTLAYQGYGRGLPRDFLEMLNRLCTNHHQPQLTLLLDLSPEEAFYRRQLRAAASDRLEQEELCFQQRVRDGYLQIAKENPTRIRVLDATQPPEVLQAEAILAIRSLKKTL